MLDELFTTLTLAMTDRFGIALGASFAWGIASILLSPCHLTSIPLIIGFLTAGDEKKGARGLTLSFVFSVGILIAIAVIGAITAALGRMLGDIGPYGNYLVAAIFLIMGLFLMDLIRLPDWGIALRPLGAHPPLLSALTLGLVFGIALGPCTFAFMAPVLGVVFQMAGTNMTEAGILLLSFGLGHTAVITATGGVASRVQAYLNWTNRSNVVLWAKRTAGLLVVFGGFYAIYVS